MRNWALLRALAALGHRTTLVAYDAPDATEGLGEVKRVCECVEYIPPPETARTRRNSMSRLRSLAAQVPHGAWKYQSKKMSARLAELLGTGVFDAVICNEIYVLINLPRPCPVPLVLDKQDVTHLILRRYLDHESNPALRAYGWLEHAKLQRWERQACASARLVVACSETDASWLRALCPEARISVVPNVIDVDAYAVGDPGEENTLLYCGSIEWYPNRDAVQFFLSEVMPVLRREAPGAKLIVTGSKASPEFMRYVRKGEVEFTGRVPDVRPVIAKCAVSIVPLRIGSGTRLKILEAAAMGKAVVSTQLGAEGLDFAEGTEIELADTPQEFARAVAYLLADPQRRASIGLAARRRVEAQYTLRSVEKAMAAALETMMPVPLGHPA